VFSISIVTPTSFATDCHVTLLIIWTRWNRPDELQCRRRRWERERLLEQIHHNITAAGGGLRSNIHRREAVLSVHVPHSLLQKVFEMAVAGTSPCAVLPICV
jgi:hypothetical protein